MKTKATIQKRFIVFFTFLLLANFAIPSQTANASPTLENSTAQIEVLDLLSYPLLLSYDSSDMSLSSMNNELIISRVDREEEFTMESWMLEFFDQVSELLTEDAEEKIEMAEWMVNCRTWRTATDASSCGK